MDNKPQDPRQEGAPQTPGSHTEPFAVDEGATSAPAGPGLTDNEKALAGLSYVSQLLLPAVMPVVLLLSDESKRSDYVRYHAVQSLGLLVAAVLYELAALIVVLIFAGIAPCLLALLWVLFFVPAVPIIYYGLKAFGGEMVGIPYLTDLLRKNGWL
jgi:uncharacterized membrane protein